MTLPIGVTLGDPCGIGPEIVARILAGGNCARAMTLFGSPHLLTRTCQALGIDPFWSEHGSAKIRLEPVGPNPKQIDPEDKEVRAKMVLEGLNRAVAAAMAGEIDSLVTAPVDKSVVRVREPQFRGHTEYLAQRAGVEKTVMLLDNTDWRVMLLTTHIPLRDVPTQISQERTVKQVLLTARALVEHFGFDHPSFVLTGINPHGGETVPEAEEIKVLAPAVEELRTHGVEIEGPIPADTCFPMARGRKWDVIVSPYHDQGLVAVKAGGVERVVNVTLGLPFVRVSPGHGVAYDLFGRGRADLRSMKRALTVAETKRLR